jgi:hypothetical protein
MLKLSNIGSLTELVKSMRIDSDYKKMNFIMERYLGRQYTWNDSIVFTITKLVFFESGITIGYAKGKCSKSFVECITISIREDLKIYYAVPRVNFFKYETD